MTKTLRSSSFLGMLIFANVETAALFAPDAAFAGFAEIPGNPK